MSRCILSDTLYSLVRVSSSSSFPEKKEVESKSIMCTAAQVSNKESFLWESCLPFSFLFLVKRFHSFIVFSMSLIQMFPGSLNVKLTALLMRAFLFLFLERHGHEVTGKHSLNNMRNQINYIFACPSPVFYTCLKYL